MKDYGLYDKYTVIDNSTGYEKEDCFVLCPLKDPVAIEAIKLYAQLTPNKILAQDLLDWLAVFELINKEAQHEDTD